MEQNVPIGPTWSNLVERIERVQQYSNLVVGWAANTGLVLKGGPQWTGSNLQLLKCSSEVRTV